jgi:hypothetical protein
MGPTLGSSRKQPGLYTAEYVHPRLRTHVIDVAILWPGYVHDHAQRMSARTQHPESRKSYIVPTKRLKGQATEEGSSALWSLDLFCHLRLLGYGLWEGVLQAKFEDGQDMVAGTWKIMGSRTLRRKKRSCRVYHCDWHGITSVSSADAPLC